MRNRKIHVHMRHTKIALQFEIDTEFTSNGGTLWTGYTAGKAYMFVTASIHYMRVESMWIRAHAISEAVEDLDFVYKTRGFRESAAV